MKLFNLICILFVSACAQQHYGTAEDRIDFGNSVGVDELPAGNTNDWPVSDRVRHLFSCHASGSTITGFAPSHGADADGEFLMIRNQGMNPCTIAHQSTFSDSIDRVTTPTGRDILLMPNRSMYLDWDKTSLHWYVVTSSAFEGVISTATPARSFGTAFCPSSTRPVMGYYSVRIESTFSLSGGESGRVELLSDTSNPPTTVRARMAGGATGTAVSGLSMVDTAEGVLSYLVPAGHCVLIRTVDETGTPTYTLTTQAEQTL